MQPLIDSIFKNVFYARYNTLLIGGYDEPYYIAPRGADSALICYREDYIASALHEVAHWCIAGPARRLVDDYGYWYAPDGRTPQQQKEFEAAELRPQALEWIFSKSIGVSFRISVDNLMCDRVPDTTFSTAVLEQVKRYLRDGLPDRAIAFTNALSEENLEPIMPLDPKNYGMKELTL